MPDKPSDGGIVPPFLVLHDFLPDETAASLLAHALAHEAAFEPSKMYVDGGVKLDPSSRVSAGLRELGPFRNVLEARIAQSMSDLSHKLGVPPFTSSKIECDLVAHNDGGFLKRHIDTHTTSDSRHVRVLSAVYYFHALPRGFSGGALRLHAIGGDGRFVDIEPVHNSLLAFPAWAPHEVMPVQCPSKRFSSSRFAINCWVSREKA